MRYLFLFSFTILLLTYNYAHSQDVQRLITINQIDSIKSSYSGKVILFNFWASWCAPCVQEFPELVKLYSDYKSKNFILVMISLDAPEDLETKVKPFLLKKNVDFITYLGDFKNPDDIMNYFDKDWDGAIPASFIFDKRGNLNTKFIGKHDYNYFSDEIKKVL